MTSTWPFSPTVTVKYLDRYTKVLRRAKLFRNLMRSVAAILLVKVCVNFNMYCINCPGRRYPGISSNYIIDIFNHSVTAYNKLIRTTSVLKMNYIGNKCLIV